MEVGKESLALIFKMLERDAPELERFTRTFNTEADMLASLKRHGWCADA